MPAIILQELIQAPVRLLALVLGVTILVVSVIALFRVARGAGPRSTRRRWAAGVSIAIGSIVVLGAIGMLSPVFAALGTIWSHGIATFLPQASPPNEAVVRELMRDITRTILLIIGAILVVVSVMGLLRVLRSDQAVARWRRWSLAAGAGVGLVLLVGSFGFFAPVLPWLDDVRFDVEQSLEGKALRNSFLVIGWLFIIAAAMTLWRPPIRMRVGRTAWAARGLALWWATAGVWMVFLQTTPAVGWAIVVISADGSTWNPLYRTAAEKLEARWDSSPIARWIITDRYIDRLIDNLDENRRGNRLLEGEWAVGVPLMMYDWLDPARNFGESGYPGGLTVKYRTSRPGDTDWTLIERETDAGGVMPLPWRLPASETPESFDLWFRISVDGRHRSTSKPIHVEVRQTLDELVEPVATEELRLDQWALGFLSLDDSDRKPDRINVSDARGYRYGEVPGGPHYAIFAGFAHPWAEFPSLSDRSPGESAVVTRRTIRLGDVVLKDGTLMYPYTADFKEVGLGIGFLIDRGWTLIDGPDALPDTLTATITSERELALLTPTVTRAWEGELRIIYQRAPEPDEYGDTYWIATNAEIIR